MYITPLWQSIGISQFQNKIAVSVSDRLVKSYTRAPCMPIWFINVCCYVCSYSIDMCMRICVHLCSGIISYTQ